VHGRVSSSALVGRAAELTELELALDEAATGEARFALVGGESGVGKTRLVSEFAARAAAGGSRVLSGDCLELEEGELPYAPVAAMLRALVRDQDPALEAIPPPLRSELATLLPALGWELGDDDVPSRGSARGRLFEALLWLVDRLGQSVPVLLVIEDLHWADRATRACLAFLGRNLGRERVLVVATYRRDELRQRHELRALLAELTRLGGSRLIELAPLTREELSLQLGDLLGGVPDEGLVERVFARSEGYPLFVEELMTASPDGRGALPAVWRDALMVRIEQLSAPAQAVLRGVAVGQRLDDELVLQITGLEEAAAGDAIREAVANNILVVAAEGGYRFRHALLREVVANDLLPGERRALDLRLARALEARLEREGTSVHLAAAIANHFDAAGDWVAAVRASMRAADAAEQVHAYGQAGALLERVVELFDLVPEAEALAGADRVQILGRAAENQQLEGDPARQETLARAALALVDEHVEPHRAARLLGTLHDAEWHLGRGEESLVSIQRGLSLLAPDEISLERGELLRLWATRMMLRGRNTEAIEAAREVLRVADALGATGLRSRGLNTLGTSLIILGDVDAGVRALRDAIALAEDVGDGWRQNAGHLNLADALHLAGRLREARAVVEEGLARNVRSHRLWLVILRAELAIEAGDWDDAAATLHSIRERPVGNTLVNLDLRRAELALGRAQHGLARGLLDEAARVGAGMREAQFTSVQAALRAELERRAGDLAAGRRAIRDGLDAIDTGTEEPARLARVLAVATTIEADAAQRARDLGDRKAERLAVEQADQHVTRVQALITDRHSLAAGWLSQALAERTRAGGAPDPERYAEAAACWVALERPYLAAVMHFREAETQAAAGDRAAAADAAQEAHAIATQLAAEWLRAEIEALAARARLALSTDHATEPKSGEAETADPFGLTTRERQVLELLAHGATNREIGAQLFMAEKTASVHVSRILAKLGVRSRTEAASVAHRTGLTT
jgi:DNA-binding CsgD family transcriptional regulator/tetratricopeptide (TPR) repeat protein